MKKYPMTAPSLLHLTLETTKDSNVRAILWDDRCILDVAEHYDVNVAVDAVTTNYRDRVIGIKVNGCIEVPDALSLCEAACCAFPDPDYVAR